MKKILVVDDNSNERSGLCRLLERAGYEVRSAADGVEALQKVRNDNFDLMLLDIWMPRMDGLDREHSFRLALLFVKSKAIYIGRLIPKSKFDVAFGI